MFQEFIGKDVEILVAFSMGYAGGGAIPCKYCGKILDVSESHVKISFTGYNNNQIRVINANYIIEIREEI